MIMNIFDCSKFLIGLDYALLLIVIDYMFYQ